MSGVVTTDGRDETVSVRKQYHFRPGATGLDAWDVDRLIELSRDLPIHYVDVSTIRAVQLQVLPEPNFRNCRPSELSYDD